MQFHGFGTTSMTLTDAFSTMIEELKETVLTLCAQLMEAMRYLHHVLHNDLKCNNILIGERGTGNYSEVYTASSDRLWESNNSRTRKTLLPLWKWKDRIYPSLFPFCTWSCRRTNKTVHMYGYSHQNARVMYSQMSFSKIFVQAYCAKWIICKCDLILILLFCTCMHALPTRDHINHYCKWSIPWIHYGHYGTMQRKLYHCTCLYVYMWK